MPKRDTQKRKPKPKSAEQPKKKVPQTSEREKRRKRTLHRRMQRALLRRSVIDRMCQLQPEPSGSTEAEVMYKNSQYGIVNQPCKCSQTGCNDCLLGSLRSAKGAKVVNAKRSAQRSGTKRQKQARTKPKGQNQSGSVAHRKLDKRMRMCLALSASELAIRQAVKHFESNYELLTSAAEMTPLCICSHPGSDLVKVLKVPEGLHNLSQIESLRCESLTPSMPRVAMKRGAAKRPEVKRSQF